MQMEMGGSERLVHNLALKINRKLFRPSIAWFLGDRELEEFKGLGIPLYHVPKTKRIDLSTMRHLEKIIKKNSIDIVNAHHFMPLVYSFYGCKIKNNIKLIYTGHSKWEVEQLSWKWTKMGSLLLKYSDGAVGVDAAVTKIIKKIFNLNSLKAVTIPNGVDIATFTKPVLNERLKREFGIIPKDKVIGMVANFKKIKNHIFLLKAFRELFREYKDVKLLFVGQGFKGDSKSSDKEIRNFIKTNSLDDNVLLLGYRSDIPDLLNIMDVFCLTSFKEGLPISLIEAMAAGLPVVGTNVEGIRDIIIHNRNGFLVQLGDIKGLRDALYALVKNDQLRDKMGRESKELANRAYSLDSCINHYQNLFLSIMK